MIKMVVYEWCLLVNGLVIDAGLPQYGCQHPLAAMESKARAISRR